MRRRSEPARRVRRRLLTGGGRQLLVGGLVLVALGRILGLSEVIGLGIGMWSLIIIALGATRLRSIRLTVTRRITPTRIFAGEAATVSVESVNPGRGTSASLHLDDHVFDAERTIHSARLAIPPLAPGLRSVTSYSITARRRGVLTFGRMEAESIDPCGVATRRQVVVESTQAVVLPRFERLVAPRTVLDTDDPSGPNRPSVAGSEFAGLREYAPGDDLRKVHWPTSARRDDLVIRHDANPIQRACVVALDGRSDVQDGATFERAVSAATGIIVAAHRADLQVRLVVTDGFDSAAGKQAAHLDMILDKLAMVELARTSESRATPDRGAIVLITTPQGAGSHPLTPIVDDLVVFTSGSPTDAFTSPVVPLEVGIDESFGALWNLREVSRTDRRGKPIQLGANR